MERQLNFYSECRRALASLDVVKSQLVLSTTSLTMRTLRLAGGKHNKKTAAFVRVRRRACVSHMHVCICEFICEYAAFHCSYIH